MLSLRPIQHLGFGLILFGLGCMAQLPDLGEVEGRCGDGVVGAGEACDDGNDSDNDACTNQCAPARCGDSFVQGDEACDDGNINDRDACTNACAAARCGDGIWRRDLLFVDDPGFERCDDGNVNENDACTTLCAPPACGDGIEQVDEDCDDGNTVDTDECLTNCSEASCGDGVTLQGVEQCDGGDDCTEACTLMTCGNGELEGSEVCDDGNDILTDACAYCQHARCGDGWVRSDLARGEPGYEACDDGNLEPGDTCSVECLVDDHGNSSGFATSIRLPQGRLETYFEGLARGQVENPSDRDYFSLRPSVSGVYRFDVDGVGRGNPTCRVLDVALTVAGYNGDRAPGSAGCSIDLFVAAETTAYLEVTSEDNRGFSYQVSIQTPCGNGVVDEGEECDPEAPNSNVFRCRKDCRNRRMIALAGYTGCAIVDGSVRCWGSNAGLLLGRDFTSSSSCLQRRVDYYGDMHDLQVPTSRGPIEVISAAARAEDLSGGWNEGVCALFGTDGVQYCWGRQTRDYTTHDRGGTFNTNATSHCADDPNVEYQAEPPNISISSCMPEPIPYAYYRTNTLPTNYNSIGMTMGAFNKCMVSEAPNPGTVSCWGSRKNGVSGVGPFTPVTCGGCIDSGLAGPTVISMPGNLPAEYVSIGNETACAILEGGRIACWGQNNFGQTGSQRMERDRGCLTEACEMTPALVPVEMGQIVALSVGGDHVCAVNQRGYLYCWGRNDRYQTGLRSDDRLCTSDEVRCVRSPQRLMGLAPIIDVAAGQAHTCALNQRGRVICWGDNAYGQLGSGSVGAVRPGGGSYSREPITVGRLGTSLGLTAGKNSNCSRSITGQIYCWGDNSQGQLGDGNCTPAVPAPIEVDLR